MCGYPGTERAMPPRKEIEYLDTLVRGVYALRDLPAGHVLTPDDYYLAVPLQKGQLSCRELLNGLTLSKDCAQDAPLMVDLLDSPYSRDEGLRSMIYKRGL